MTFYFVNKGNKDLCICHMSVISRTLALSVHLETFVFPKNLLYKHTNDIDINVTLISYLFFVSYKFNDKGSHNSYKGDTKKYNRTCNKLIHIQFCLDIL